MVKIREALLQLLAEMRGPVLFGPPCTAVEPGAYAEGGGLGGSTPHWTSQKIVAQ